MLVAHLVVGTSGALAALVVLSSAIRSVVVPQPFPARLARIAILAARAPLRVLAARAAARGRHRRREELLSWQGPLGLFAQIATWALLVDVAFAALLWATDGGELSWAGVDTAARASASSLTTLGLVQPTGTGAQDVAFVEGAVGLVLLALAVTYFPSIYSAFSQREALVSRLVTRAGAPPTPTGLLIRSSRRRGLDALEELWSAWEQWFIELGETHTTFPVLLYFRSPRPKASWVTAAVTVLDAAALARHALDVEASASAQLASDAAVASLEMLAAFLGVPEDQGAGPLLERQVFFDGLDTLRRAGLPVVADRDAAWEGFASERGRYEPSLLALAGIADAVPTPWLPRRLFSDHQPPILRPVRRPRR